MGGGSVGGGEEKTPERAAFRPCELAEDHTEAGARVLGQVACVFRQMRVSVTRCCCICGS